MKDTQVQFEHYKAILPDEVLSQCGSRYLSRREAGRAARAWILQRVRHPIGEHHLTFGAAQLTCANEVFPEAALSDPVSDLEVWDEWRSGLRRFPHPGVYSRLNIFGQERKTSATSSVGVIGEIMTGLLAQAYISPIVAVRPIRRWPDFIMYGPDGRYSFVESKASATLDGAPQPELRHVQRELLEEGLADAVQELNAEASLRIWLFFSNVAEVSASQVTATVCALELETDPERRQSIAPSVPPAVIDGLMEQALLRASGELTTDQPEFRDPDPNIDPERRKDLWTKLKELAQTRTKEVVEAVYPLDLVDDLAEKTASKIVSCRMPKGFLKAQSLEGRRFEEAKRAASSGLLGTLRTAGRGEQLFLSDMSLSSLRGLRASWSPSWTEADKPWKKTGNTDLWRCSSAVLALGGSELESLPVES